MRVIDTMASRWDAMPSGNESWPLGSPGSWDAVGNCGAVTVATVVYASRTTESQNSSEWPMSSGTPCRHYWHDRTARDPGGSTQSSSGAFFKDVP